MVGEIFTVVFGSIGTGVLWIWKRGKVPYTEIFTEKSFTSDLIGGIVLTIVVAIAYLINN